MATTSTRLSPHFALGEFQSPRDPVKVVPAKVVANLTYLCERVLEPLRAARDGRPLVITSGWRSPLYNLRVGGKILGYHPKGQAADIATVTLDDQLDLMAKASRIEYSDPETGKKIRPVGGIGFYPGRGFIHVDTGHRKNGRIRTWMRTAEGKDVPLPAHIVDRLRAGGAIEI